MNAEQDALEYADDFIEDSYSLAAEVCSHIWFAILLGLIVLVLPHIVFSIESSDSVESFILNFLESFKNFVRN